MNVFNTSNIYRQEYSEEVGKKPVTQKWMLQELKRFETFLLLEAKFILSTKTCLTDIF